MTNVRKFSIVTIATIAIAVLPASATAGTRAGNSNVQPVAGAKASAVSTAQGPKNGFPNAPGLVIANIKANENAAFKRKSNGT